MASNRMSISNSSGILFPFFNNFCDAAPSWARTDSCGRVQCKTNMLRMFTTLKNIALYILFIYLFKCNVYCVIYLCYYLLLFIKQKISTDVKKA